MSFATLKWQRWSCIALLLSLTLGITSARGDEESPALAPFNARIEESVERALDYLAKQQRDDNLFPGQYGDTTAVPALVGMAFLSKGYSPGLGPYGETINRCIDLVLANEQQRDGKPSGYIVRTGGCKMYAHCISTLFLSEVSGMVDPERQAKIDELLPRALQLIVDAAAIEKDQQFRGGWRYDPDSRDADLSLTGWAIMALRSARLNGAQVPDQTIRGAVEFIFRCKDPNTNGERGFGYQPNQSDNAAMTGVAILCLSLTGQHENAALTRAGDWLLNQNVNGNWGGGHFFYCNYYCTQAMFQLKGNYWEQWALKFYENALSHQQEDGSWGDPYQTAMTVLALTVSYRQLPVYQR